MQLRSSLFLLVALAALSGCTTLSEKAAQVQVHGQVSNLLDSCRKLGPVTAAAPRVWGPDQAFREAKVRLRETTSDLGGDTVAILNTDTLLTEVTIQGRAFKCY